MRVFRTLGWVVLVTLLLPSLPVQAADKPVLDKGKKVLITRIRQPVIGKKIGKSGQQRAELALQSAFNAYADRVTYEPSCVSTHCLAGPKVKGYSYYVSPQFVYWVNQSNKGMGERDQVELKIAIYDVNTREVIHNAIISAGSGRAMLGGPSDNELLSGAIRRHINALYDPS